jgi:hypothetical protein
MKRFTARQVQDMLVVEDYTDIAYGYTFDRATVCIYFEKGKLVRQDTRFHGQQNEQLVNRQESEEFDPSFFHDGIKRFYDTKVNADLLVFFNTFSTGLSLTPG